MIGLLNYNLSIVASLRLETSLSFGVVCKLNCFFRYHCLRSKDWIFFRLIMMILVWFLSTVQVLLVYTTLAAKKLIIQGMPYLRRILRFFFSEILRDSSHTTHSQSRCKTNVLLIHAHCSVAISCRPRTIKWAEWAISRHTIISRDFSEMLTIDF